MSRIANKPVAILPGIEVTFSDHVIELKGKLGTLKQAIHPHVQVKQVDQMLIVTPVKHKADSDALAGTKRSLINNMMLGVSEGFEKKLVLVGVGYRAKAQGNRLSLTLGFSHPVEKVMPDGIQVATPAVTEVVIKGMNKQQVAQVAANLRAIRPPEPYKGKGIRYSDEVVKKKKEKKK